MMWSVALVEHNPSHVGDFYDFIDLFLNEQDRGAAAESSLF